MKKIILILITLLCINIQGQVHWPYSMVKIKHCSSNVRPSVSNNKQFFWDITDKEVNHRPVLSEYGFLKTNQLDSNIVNDIKLCNKAQSHIERYMGYDEELYLIYYLGNRNNFMLSFQINRLIENNVIGRHQLSGSNNVDMFWTKENGKYITYVIVNSLTSVKYEQLSQLHE